MRHAAVVCSGRVPPVSAGPFADDWPRSWGLLITLSAVVAYSAYITWQVTGLRKLQTELVDRNRKDSLQFLRIQNDLNLLAVAMRDMVSSDEPYPLTAWSAQFQRIRTDLDDAMRLEAGFAAASRTPEQSAFLAGSFTQFWDAVDRVFALAREGKEKEAREQIQHSLQERQAALSTAVARLLVQNSENEEQAGNRIVQIYDRVQRQVYFFLAATLLAILLNGLSLIRWNRRLFARLAEISERRSELAQKLICHPGIHASLHLARTARRVRTDPDRDRIDAATRGHSCARRFVVARRPAGGSADCSVNAGKRS